MQQTLWAWVGKDGTILCASEDRQDTIDDACGPAFRTARLVQFEATSRGAAFDVVMRNEEKRREKDK